MKTWIITAWHWLTTSRYTRSVEQRLAQAEMEKERLRLENFALMNSLIGTAGFPAIDVSGTPRPSVAAIRNPSWGQTARRREAEATREMERATGKVAR